MAMDQIQSASREPQCTKQQFVRLIFQLEITLTLNLSRVGSGSNTNQF